MISFTGLPFISFFKNNHSPFGVSTNEISDNSTWLLLAHPRAAFVKLPSLSKAAFLEGPFF